MTTARGWQIACLVWVACWGLNRWALYDARGKVEAAERCAKDAAGWERFAFELKATLNRYQAGNCGLTPDPTGKEALDRVREPKPHGPPDPNAWDALLVDQGDTCMAACATPAEPGTPCYRCCAKDPATGDYAPWPPPSPSPAPAGVR